LQKAVYFDIYAFISLMKGNKTIMEVIETHRDFYTGALTMAELISAEAEVPDKKTVKMGKFRELISAFTVLDFTKEDAEKAGEIIAKARASGKDIGINEAILAAQCARRGLVLVTENKGMQDLMDICGLDVKLI
jgi:predicted nucleic acid-binding protein